MVKTKKPKTSRITTTVEQEIKDLVVEYAGAETDGNESFAVRKILREFLTNWKIKKKTS